MWKGKKETRIRGRTEKIHEISEKEVDTLKEETVIRQKQIEEELPKIYDYFADGAILRSRCTWYEKGEKVTNIFYH